MKTVLEVIQATTAYFQKHEIESPRLNIEHLLAHVLGKRRMELYMEFDRPLGDLQLEPLRELVRRRSLGEPLQHLLGTAEFCGLTFLCDKRALIPRPETEQLVELILGQSRDYKRILDVGTGSGVIALSLAAQLPESEVHAVDVSPDALVLAQENALKLKLQERVRFSRSHLLEAAEGTYDLIVANLPYVTTGELPTLSREVRHDPVAALDGGLEGLDLLLQLVQGAKTHLQGRLALEIGHEQSQRLSLELARENYHDICPVDDYQGRHRFLFAIHG